MGMESSFVVFISSFACGDVFGSTLSKQRYPNRTYPRTTAAKHNIQLVTHASLGLELDQKWSVALSSSKGAKLSVTT